jgi:hypothetical protein
MEDNTGGPAFPSENVASVHPGMTLRDYFAAKVLQGMCAHSGSYGINNGPYETSKRTYEIADAILEARK